MLVEGHLVENMFSTRSNETHAKFLRPIQKHYTQAGLRGFEPICDEVIELFLQKLDSGFAQSGEPCPMDNWLLYSKSYERKPGSSTEALHAYSDSEPKQWRGISSHRLATASDWAFWKKPATLITSSLPPTLAWSTLQSSTSSQSWTTFSTRIHCAVTSLLHLVP